MTSDRFALLERLFDESVELEPSAKVEFIERVRLDYPDVVEELEALLASHTQSDEHHSVLKKVADGFVASQTAIIPSRT